jgi:hypothetical protein
VGRYGGLPLLWHDQAKVGNLDDAMRVPEYIYQRITERQRKTLDRFEHHHGRPPSPAERARLALFPSPVRNLNGSRAISYHTFQSRFRQWVDQLDLGASCVAHQARHTLATQLLAHGAGLHHIRRYLGHVSIRMTEHYAKVATSEIEDILQHIWVAGPAAANPGQLLSAPAIPMDRSQAEALMIDLSRASTPTEGGFCTYQPVVSGDACPWNGASPATSSCCPARTCCTGGANASSGPPSPNAPPTTPPPITCTRSSPPPPRPSTVWRKPSPGSACSTRPSPWTCGAPGLLPPAVEPVVPRHRPGHRSHRRRGRGGGTLNGHYRIADRRG